MKVIFYILIILFFSYFVQCKINNYDNDKIEWVEGQALCVYWAPIFRDKLKPSAIHYIISSKSPDVLMNNEYVFMYNKLNYDLRRRNKLVKYDGGYKLSLVMFSSQLYSYFKDNTFSDGGPCYENELYTMILNGTLVCKNNNVEIKKSKYFKIIRGLKEYQK